MANGRTPGDPQMIGVPVFVTGSIALGFQLTGYVGSGADFLGAPIAITLGLTGLFLLVAAIWGRSRDRRGRRGSSRSSAASGSVTASSCSGC
jgi:hypothetical protein